MVKPLAFKGDKKPKKRKVVALEDDQNNVQAEQSGTPAAIDHLTDDDSWVTAETPKDLSGPVMIILPSREPFCIACDANGKVFASQIENILDDDPATAEPHDVRQVWMTSKVSETDQVSLKGHHGRYLSCSKTGLLSATQEAISPEETFQCILSPDVPASFSIQTIRENYITFMEDLKADGLRGDAESISFTTTFKIRMQARFKPKIKASREQKTKDRISRKELEDIVGRRLEDDEVRRLKKARVHGQFHEAILDVRVKGKHDKYT